MFAFLSKKIAIPQNTWLKVVTWNKTEGWIACGGEKGLLKILKLDSLSDTISNNAGATGGASLVETGVGQSTGGRGVGVPSSSTGGTSSSLRMNQTLEGHQGNVLVAAWNGSAQKLTTSDEHGLVIVWVLHRGQWYEEMINTRNKSVVCDMKWSCDGFKICIAYEDGTVMVGTVDGQRLWGKECEVKLTLVEWSPDCKCILIGTVTGEVHVYDSGGLYSHKVPIPWCFDEGSVGSSRLAGMHWHNLARERQSLDPCLAIACQNGRLQLFRSDSDENPVFINTFLTCSCVSWNPSASILAVAGSLQPVGKDATGIIQFYSPMGQHLRNLQVPGTMVQSLSWEGTGLRIAMAVNYHVYFASIRPQYLCVYFSTSLVFAFSLRECHKYSVVFWNRKTDESHTKYVNRLLHLKSGNEFCVIVAQDEDRSDAHYTLQVCNSIGFPVECLYLKFEPLHVAMTNTHVIASDKQFICVWSYRTQTVQTPGDGNSDTLVATSLLTGASYSRRFVEQYFHIDDNVSNGTTTKENFLLLSDQLHPLPELKDPIACLSANEECLLVARLSGIVYRYSLPRITLEETFSTNPQIPQRISINCNSTLMTCLNISGELSLYDVEIRIRTGAFATAVRAAAKGGGSGGGEVPRGAKFGDLLDFERKDVWDVLWACDSPDLFCMMEKSRMYVVRGLHPEEPVVSRSYIVSFKDLQIQSVLMDEVMKNPEDDLCLKNYLVEYDTKSLREMQRLLNKTTSNDRKKAIEYIEQNPHPRLWQLLAESALNSLDLKVAGKAFAKCQDYQGIQFLKRLKMLDDQIKQKAEVAAYLHRYDEAERLYCEIDRRDLALALRMKLGDWFRVLQLAQLGMGEAEVVQKAYNQIGDYYAERRKFDLAAQYYSKTRNVAALAKVYNSLEDFTELENLIKDIPEGDPLLSTIGRQFRSVGLCEPAAEAFVKAGNVKEAVDSCVLLHKWDLALQLAEQHRFPQIESIFTKYTQHLLDGKKKMEVVQLYRRAKRYADAAKLLIQLAEENSSLRQHRPDRIRKLYLLAALEAEKFKQQRFYNTDNMTQESTSNNNINHNNSSSSNTSQHRHEGTTEALRMQALQSLIHQDQTVATDRSLEFPWRGAEAYHLFLLIHQQLYRKDYNGATCASIRLMEYEDLLGTHTPACLLALSSYYSQYWRQCSNAFVRLENSEDIPAPLRAKYEDLALQIFTRHPPRDPSVQMHPCPKCKTPLDDWVTSCLSCGVRLPFCVATGKTIFILDSHHTPHAASFFPHGGDAAAWLGVATESIVTCKTCRHKMYATEAQKRQVCPLCHALLRT